MNDAEFLDALHFAFLVGLFTGVPFTLALREAFVEFTRWRRHLQVNRAVATLRPRCSVTDDCCLYRGHRGDCDVEHQS